MANFSCGACGSKGETDYDETHRGCPARDSLDVVFLLAIEEVPDEVLQAFVALSSADDEAAED